MKIDIRILIAVITFAFLLGGMEHQIYELKKDFAKQEILNTYFDRQLDQQQKDIAILKEHQKWEQ
jgi:hypothetical protein